MNCDITTAPRRLLMRFVETKSQVNAFRTIWPLEQRMSINMLAGNIRI